MDQNKLIDLAWKARENAYVPYSHFKVGACIALKDGTFVQGCNIENAAFSPTNCAERTAFFKAVSEGQQDFSAIVIVGNKADVKMGEGDYCAPCGVCRQVMAEFCNPETFRVILAKSPDDYKEFLLKELLPLGFTSKDFK